MSLVNGTNQNYFNFYSDEMFVTKDYLVQHHLKLTYQRQLISNLDSKHKEWSKCLDNFQINSFRSSLL